ncbi:hypothetical protein [Luteimonas sp. MC1895]|uniref:hypothetical protein n=1 Tax=Luteimonas sp. MC1895 TaxID=2819513 RepID=UPI0018F0DEE1|nr:hypothetical protein [Luteimonas sp. MC1895]MBJ6979918.1 hypothetical protein [Luteimonas sp. MC1895]
MSRCKPTLFAALLMLGGCASTLPTGDAPWIDPGQAVLRAAAAPHTGVTGVFALTVQATGRTDKVHLNSERDYRDPRNLSIAVMPRAATELEALHGRPLEDALRGKRIQVAGTARRVRIDFTVDGERTGKYYYQTHVRVTRASQIRVL